MEDKDFMDIEFESGFDQDLRDKEYRGVQLDHLGKNPPNVFNALVDGIAVGFDHTVEFSVGQNIYAAAADLGVGSTETINPQMAKQHFDLDLDEDISVEKAVILSEMKRQRVKNIRDLGRHSGFNAVVGFGGAMVGNMISPTAWLSGNVLAHAAGTGAALARSFSNTAAYLKAMEKLNKTRNFARSAVPSVAANRAAQLSKVLRSNVDKAMRPMRNIVNSPTGQAAVYNGIGNLMEELGVQAVEANKGHKYELGPMDIGFAIMAPAMLSGLAAAAKVGVSAATTYKNAKTGRPNVKSNSKIETDLVKDFLKHNEVDHAKALKELEEFGKQFPHRKMEFAKLKQDLNAIFTPARAVKDFLVGMGEEGNLRTFIQDPTKFPEFGELPGSLKAKVQARADDLKALNSVRQVLTTEARHRAGQGMETEYAIKWDQKTDEIRIQVPRKGLKGELRSRRAQAIMEDPMVALEELIKKGLVQRVPYEKSIDPSTKSKEYVIPSAEKYIKRYSDLTVKEATAEQAKLDRKVGDKANRELSEVVDLLDEAIPSRLLSIQENKLATFKKTGMFLTKGTKELLIGTTPRELELAAAHINAFKTGRQIGSDDFKDIMKKAEESGVVERKPRIDQGLETDVYEIKLTANKMFSEEATELRDILASASKKFREKLQNRLNKTPSLLDKEISLFDAIFKRGFGHSVKEMYGKTGVSLFMNRHHQKSINILKDAEGKPTLLQNFLNKSGAGHIDVADLIKKLREQGEVAETANEFRIRMRFDKFDKNARPSGIAIALDAIKVTDAVKNAARVAEIDRLKGSLSTPEPIKTDTLFGDLSGSPIKGQDTKMRVDLFKKSGMYISPKSRQLHIAVSKLKEAQKYFDEHGIKTNIEAKLQEMAKAGTINKPKRGPSGPNPVTKEGSYKGLYYSIPLKDSNYYRYGSARSIIKTDSSDQALQDAISLIHENTTSLRDFTDSIRALGEDYKKLGEDKAEQLGLSEIEALDELFKRFPEGDIEEALFAARRTAVDFDSNAGIGDLIPQLRSLEALQAHIKDSAAKGKKDPSDLTLDEMLTVDVEKVAKAIDDNKVNYDKTKKRYENTKPEVKSEITAEESLSRLDPELAKVVKDGLREFKSCTLKVKGGKS